MKGKLAVIKDPQIPSPDSDISNSPEPIINVLLLVIGAIAVGMIIFAAVQMITSGGDTEKAKTGRKNLMWGVVGLFIALSARFIAGLVMGLGG